VTRAAYTGPGEDDKGAPPAARDPLACMASGCPNRWTVKTDAGSQLCSAHAVAPPRLWPLVTDAQRRAREEDRAAPVPNWDPDNERAALAARERLRTLRAAAPTMTGPRAWAWRLRDRELAGAVLTLTQRAFWREALGFPANARAEVGGEG
jgi:hypothetical protein